MSKTWVPLLVSAGLIASPLIFAEPSPHWTLASSIQRAVEVAPEMKMANAQIGKQQGELEQAAAWPNPRVRIQVDDSLGLEDAAGGYDVTLLSLSQPLPFGRLGHQRRQAEAGLASARAQRHQRQLLLEYKVAQRLHVLQLAKAKLHLAKKRMQQAKVYQNKSQNNNRKSNSRDPLIRYLSPLETMRLDIELQVTKQTVERAKGEFNEAAASFKALLGIPVHSQISLIALTPVPPPEEFNALENSQQAHPALEANKQTIASFEAGIAVAKSQRFADPTITLFRQEGFYANGRQASNGIMLGVQMPLWNLNSGRVTQARNNVYQAQADMDIKQRELRTNLHKSYLHLGHLIKQAEHYRHKLLNPAKRMFTLTHRGFRAGELNILTLIDANNTYFGAQERYLELLQEGWLTLAQVRKSAGLLLATSSPETDIGGVK